MRYKKNIMIFFICVCLLLMIVGYYYFGNNLNINGMANNSGSWDVRIIDISCISAGKAYNVIQPSFTQSSVSFVMSLSSSDDAMTCSVIIKNNGSSSAKLNSITNTQSSNDAINYTISGLKKDDILKPGSSVTLTIDARFNSSVYATTLSKSLSIDLEWIDPSANITISDEYNKTYKIQYDNNGGEGVISSTTCAVNMTCYITLTKPIKEGYVFAGWALPNFDSVSYEPGDSVIDIAKVNSSLTLHAVWQPSISYDTYGSYQYTVPVSGTYKLEAWGAQGGYRYSSNNSMNFAGKGGYSTGTLYLEKGTILYIYVGGSGNTGGYNGGGKSGCDNASSCGQSMLYGGGASDIRVTGTTLNHRILVAGGGGSVGAPTKQGGAGGGNVGEGVNIPFVGSGCSATECGQGGTQTNGGAGSSDHLYKDTTGSFGQGGRGYYINNGYGGAGGGGWYGGSGSVPDLTSDNDRGGGGGSGYVLTNNSEKPTGYAVSDKYYMTNTDLISGNAVMPNPEGGNMIGKIGHGYIRITQIIQK